MHGVINVWNDGAGMGEITLSKLKINFEKHDCSQFYPKIGMMVSVLINCSKVINITKSEESTPKIELFDCIKKYKFDENMGDTATN